VRKQGDEHKCVCIFTSNAFRQFHVFFLLSALSNSFVFRIVLYFYFMLSNLDSARALRFLSSFLHLPSNFCCVFCCLPRRYFQTMLMSVFYLAVFAFVMTSCMDLLGNMVHLDPFLVGIVFAAAGTSFPNVFASMVVARQGNNVRWRIW